MQQAGCVAVGRFARYARARAFVLICEAKNLGVSQTRTEFMFSSEIRSVEGGALTGPALDFLLAFIYLSRWVYLYALVFLFRGRGFLFLLIVFLFPGKEYWV